MAKFKADDPALLLPTWRITTELIQEDLAKAGFESVLRDGWRAVAEAASNAARGVGIADSMHCYGCASDLICAKHGWQCGAKKCRFFVALGRAAEARKALWGGRFTRVDQPHIQGVSIALQAAMRRLGGGPESLAARDALVARWLAR